ncbi:hypothetical protein BV378_16130 [Nostoc sp. RF31YmG]|nr:hypothetical protein BV378_16130 [Nostoc sp. RF31YmG]
MGLDFSGQNLRGHNFQGKDLAGANFSYTDIRVANFTNANLKDANFSYAKAGLQRRWSIDALLVIISLVNFGRSSEKSPRECNEKDCKDCNHNVERNIYRLTCCGFAGGSW